MIRLRHLLARRLTNPAAAALLLLIVAFRLLLPPGLMLVTSTRADASGFAICSGHGALFDEMATRGAGIAPATSATPAAQAAADDLAKALAGATPSSANQHGGDLCPFSAALGIGLANTLPQPAHWLGIAATSPRPHPRPPIPFSSRRAHGPLGARAPPLPQA